MSRYDSFDGFEKERLVLIRSRRTRGRRRWGMRTWRIRVLQWAHTLASHVVAERIWMLRHDV